MAEITNAEAIRFVNEQVRPLCEAARALKARIDAAQTQWYGGIDAHFATAEDTVEDGREDQGVSRLTAGDVTTAIAQLLKTATGQAAEWNDAVVSKPCVRALHVTIPDN